MAYYLMNRVVKLARIALGMTQEELCEGICDVRVLSRSENERQELKKENFRKLMARMGRAAEPIYAVCVDKDGRLLEDRENMERAFKRFDYAAAEQYLRRMQENADDNLLTRQYLTRAEAAADYRQKRIGAEEFAERVDQTLRMTVPDYEKYVYGTDKVFPFVREELLGLLSLGNAYSHSGQYEKAKETYNAILRCLKAEYMLRPDRLTMEIAVRNSLYHVYDKEGYLEDALQTIEDCLQKTKEIDNGHAIAPLLVSKAYNYIWMVKLGGWEESRLEDAKGYLRRAYYIAAARGDARFMDIIIKYYVENFGNWSQL
ncbi:MAG: hypothetical protein HFH91_02775 [Lachnospiraceae bacterium]|nr:hypothetical protein [Lachnospiraceae bacterium]